jgi:hypothetical protein
MSLGCRLSIFVFFVVSLPVGVCAQAIPKSVVVIHADKVEIEVTNWEFLYEWHRDVPAPSGQSGRYYDVATKTSQDLFLRLGERFDHGVRELLDRKIPSSNLSAILYDWVPYKSWFELRAVTVQLRDGELISIPKHPIPGSFKDPPPDRVELEPSIELLTGNKGGWSGRLYLVGKVRRGDKMLDYKEQLLSPGGVLEGRVLEFRFR